MDAIFGMFSQLFSINVSSVIELIVWFALICALGIFLLSKGRSSVFQKR